MPHFMMVLIPYVNLLNLSRIKKKCLFWGIWSLWCHKASLYNQNGLPIKTILKISKPLRKHAYSNTCTLKILPPKMAIFHIKNSDIFHISAQNIDCEYSLEPPRRGGSNEYPQSMFLIRNNKNNVYPCKPQFYYIKVGFKGVKIIWVCFRDADDFFLFVVRYWSHLHQSARFVELCHINIALPFNG